MALLRRASLPLFVAGLLVFTPAGAAAPAFSPITVPNGQSTQALGINAHGDIVGSYRDTFLTTAGGGSFFRTHGFLLQGGTFTTIDAPDAVFLTVTRSINERGRHRRNLFRR